MTFNEVKTIAITEYLSNLGIDATYIRGNDHWYHSPLREERTPSFKVNSRLNVWFDHGTGEGGTIIDLAVKIHQCTYQEATEKLTNGNYQKAAQSAIRKKLSSLRIKLKSSEQTPSPTQGLSNI
jgi:DNA primase